MRIGELAARTGVSRRSLRYYEQHNLLHPRRGFEGWREYDEAAVQRVRAIAEMISNGLTLEGIKKLAPCLDTHESSDCEDPDLPLQIYQARLAVVDGRLDQMHRNRDRLAEHIHTLRPRIGQN